MRADIRDWAKRDFGNIFSKRKRLLATLDGIQRALCSRPNSSLIKLSVNI